MRTLMQTLKRLIRRAGRMRDGMLSSAALQKLVREIEQTRDVEYTCEEVHRLLDQFAEAVLRGQDATRLIPLVQQHLDLCPDCREEYEALLRILRASPA